MNHYKNKILWVGVVAFFGCVDTTPTVDGADYKTVKIGNQVWYAENLHTTAFSNGDPIPIIHSPKEWSNAAAGAIAAYEGEILYNWYAVNDPRGLCPSGWHVPTAAEWLNLIDFLGGESVAGEKMKSSASDKPQWDGSNDSGFSGLPVGWRSTDGGFYSSGYSGFWWSASPDGSQAWRWNLMRKSKGAYRDNTDPRKGFSVRCIQDSE